MLPTSNLPARTYATVRTLKFPSVNSLNIKDVKFRLIIIYETKTITFNVAKTISNYLKPLHKNKYYIQDTFISRYDNQFTTPCKGQSK